MNLNINRKDRCFNLISNRTDKLIISLRKPFNILSHTNLQQLIYRQLNCSPPNYNNNFKICITSAIFKTLSHAYLACFSQHCKVGMGNRNGAEACLKSHRRQISYGISKEKNMYWILDPRKV